MRIPLELEARLRRLRLLAFDVDGVMTDGRLLLSAAGEEVKLFHSRDGLALRRAREAGLELALISARASEAVARRAAGLGIPHLIQGCEAKDAALQELQQRIGCPPEETCFMGDDLLDMGALWAAGVTFTVPDAPEVIRRRCDYVTRTPGGHGAVREVIELILSAKGMHDVFRTPPSQL